METVQVAPTGDIRPRHPMKGPMTTQTLRGLIGLDPLHWRGDRASFLAFNGAFNSLLGGTILSDVDMSAYRTFINTIVFQPNPHQKLDRTLPTSSDGGDPAAGRTFFLTAPVMFGALTCIDCHQDPAGTDRAIADALDLQQSQAIKVPHLRNVYQKLNFSTSPGVTNLSGFGLTHDGIDGGLIAHFSINRFDPVLRNDAKAKQDLAAYIMSFDTGTAPAVGYSLTVNASNANDPAITNDWNVLENQSLTNVGVVAKGTIDGVHHGLLYNRATTMYEADKTGLGPLTRADLIAKAQAGDTLTIMGVPPASRRRMGIDRNANGVFDGDETLPSLTAVRSDTGITISWPTNTVGVVLEFSESLSPSSWRAETSVQSVDTGRATVSVPIAGQNRFYRLRGL
jgi:hypothetical protein